MITDETICAISTAAGTGAIATIRVSGPKAIETVDRLYKSPKAGKRLTAQRGATLHYGTLTHHERDIDEVVVALFRAPHSFTGEDSAEITCHGSVVIQRQIIKALLGEGCRMANPGEFTQRAFVNGKMDLSQAEAVADLIAAQNDTARRVALGQMRGGISTRLQTLRDELLHFLTLLELELDFSEEDVEFAQRTELQILTDKISQEIDRLRKSFALGEAIKNGVPVAIVGPTNAGKSTILNALLGEERAIVSNIHGTTRDTVEDVVEIEGVSYRFIDTAGLRTTNDVVENIGIDRAITKMKEARIVIFLSDATDEVEREKARQKIAPNIDLQTQKLLEVHNKCDLLSPVAQNNESPNDVLLISAHNACDIERLRQKIASQIDFAAVENEDAVVTNARHYEALTRAAEALTRADEGLKNNLSGELVAMEIHEVTDALASITGQISSDAVLHNIFRNFCIGK